MSWWSDWFVPLLVASFVLLIFNGGWFFTIFLWLLYLSNGSKQLGNIEKATGKKPESEQQALSSHCVVGVVVLVITGILKLVV